MATFELLEELQKRDQNVKLKGKARDDKRASISKTLFKDAAFFSDSTTVTEVGLSLYLQISHCLCCHFRKHVLHNSNKTPAIFVSNNLGEEFGR
jgi:hypothetical protein